MTEQRGDWPQLARDAAELSTVAIELAALSEPELAPLIDYLEDRPALPFLFVSVHAPSKQRVMPEEDLVSELCRIAPGVDAVVFHPDLIEDPELYRPLGRKLVIENMDSRKPTGRTADQLEDYFDALPEAGLCFDVPHAKSVDPAMEIGRAILDRFGPRLRHVHLSSLDGDCHHVPLTEQDEALFAPLLAMCRDVPWILEAHPRVP